MTELYGVDVSQFQGVINWDDLNAAANFVIIRASDGTIEDSRFVFNQSQARRVRADAGPLGISYYTHTYPTLLTPQQTADSFSNIIGALQEGENLAHDLEGNLGPDPVGWSLEFMQAVVASTGVKMALYLNQAELQAYNWKPVIDAGFSLWLADYTGNKDGQVASPSPWPFMAFRQWTNVDKVAGIPGNVDGDTFYGDFDQFYASGYKTPSVAAVSTPAPETSVSPPNTPPAEPTPPPPETSTPAKEPTIETVHTVPLATADVVPSSPMSDQKVDSLSSAPVTSVNGSTPPLSSLETKIQQIVRQELTTVMTPSSFDNMVSFLETKIGQVLVGSAATTGLTIGTAVAGAPGSTTLKVAVIGYAVNVCHALANLILHLTKV